MLPIGTGSVFCHPSSSWMFKVCSCTSNTSRLLAHSPARSISLSASSLFPRSFRTTAVSWWLSTSSSWVSNTSSCNSIACWRCLRALKVGHRIRHEHYWNQRPYNAHLFHLDICKRQAGEVEFSCYELHFTTSFSLPSITLRLQLSRTRA